MRLAIRYAGIGKEPEMGIFSDRMDQDLQIRGYSPRTRTTYLACAKAFVAHFQIPPDKLGREDLRNYQLYLINERRVSWCYFNQTVAALLLLQHDLGQGLGYRSSPLPEAGTPSSRHPEPGGSRCHAGGHGSSPRKRRGPHFARHHAPPGE